MICGFRSPCSRKPHRGPHVGHQLGVVPLGRCSVIVQCTRPAGHGDVAQNRMAKRKFHGGWMVVA